MELVRIPTKELDKVSDQVQKDLGFPNLSKEPESIEE